MASVAQIGEMKWTIRLVNVALLALLVSGSFFFFNWQWVTTLVVPLFISQLLAYAIVPLVERCCQWTAWTARTVLMSSYGLLFLIAIVSYQWMKTSWSEQMPHIMKAMTKASHHPTMHFVQQRFTVPKEWVLATPKWLMILALIPIFLYYIIVDWGKWQPRFIRLLPTKRAEAQQFLHNYGRKMRAYSYSVVYVSFLLVGVSWLCFTALKLPFAVPLALLVGFLNIIPYFGPVIAMVPALVVAAIVSLQTAFLVALFLLVLQFIEGNVLSPWIVKEKLNIHPMLTLVILIVAGEWFQMIGLMLAIPFVIVVQAAYETYKNEC